MEKEFEVFKTWKHIKFVCCENSTRYDPIEIDCAIVEEALLKEQDLEKFTRLVIEKRVAMDLITNEETKDYIKYNSHCDKYDFIVPLTQDEFTFIKEMIKKYGKRI